MIQSLLKGAHPVGRLCQPPAFHRNALQQGLVFAIQTHDFINGLYIESFF
jgi:hypothetical protein